MGNNERQLYQSVQFDLDGDNLIIKAEHIASPQFYMGEYYDYFSGMLRVKNPISPPSCGFVSNGFTYGLFEMRCKMPANTDIDFWPTFWLFHDPSEIDIFEFHSRTWNEILAISEPNTNHFSTNLIDHDDCITIDAQEFCATCTESYNKISSPNLSSDIHTFQMAWLPPAAGETYGKITYFLDGRELRTISNAMVPFCAMELMINLAVGGNCCDSPTPNDNFIIDSIKVYQRSDYSLPYKSEYAWMSAPLSYAFNPNHVVESSGNSLCINPDGNRIFYRGIEGKANQFRWDEPSQTWKHSWLEGMDAPDAHDIVGDIVVGENDEVYYRGADGFIQTYYKVGGSWTHAWIDPGASGGKKISSNPNSLSIGVSNELFYRGQDNTIHQYYKSGTAWIHKKLKSSVPWEQQVAGDVEVASDNNKVFYRGNDGYIHYYQKSGSSWTHHWIESSSADASTKISAASNSLVINSLGNIFYRGATDNALHRYIYNSGTGLWTHSVIHSGLLTTPFNHLINGPMKVSSDDKIIYVGNDQKLQYFYNSGLAWQHGGEIANYYLYDPKVYHYFDVSMIDEKIFYVDGNNHMFVYYWTTCEQLDNECTEQTLNVYRKPNTVRNITIYPNPVNDLLYIDIPSSFAINQLKMYDLNGRYIKSIEYENKYYPILSMSEI
jgi:hypothetical protein